MLIWIEDTINNWKNDLNDVNMIFEISIITRVFVSATKNRIYERRTSYLAII